MTALLTPLRLLLLEDDPNIAARLVDEVRRAGFDPIWTRVGTEIDYIKQLDSGPELLLADFDLAEYDLFAALEAVRRRGLNIPVIVVSGAVGEEAAVAAMQAGAADYVLLDRLVRLGPAIQRAIQHFRWDDQNREKLRASGERFRVAAETASDVIFEWDPSTEELQLFGDPGERLGYPARDFPRKFEDWVAIIHPDERERIAASALRLIQEGAPYSEEYRVIAKDGQIRFWSGRAQAIQATSSGGRRIVGVVTDITERILAQERIARMNAELQALSARLMRSQDEERRRLARELHDSTAQTLTALALSLGSLAKVPAIAEGQDAQEPIRHCLSLVEQCIREIGSLSQALHPPLLDEFGLEASLRDYLSGFEKSAGIEVEFHARQPLRRWPAAIETAVFRFAQEQLSEIHRRSGATRLEVRIGESRGSLIIELEGTAWFGAPSVDAEAAAGESVPLAELRERARQVGGEFLVHSWATGIRAQLSIPDGQTRPLALNPVP